MAEKGELGRLLSGGLSPGLYLLETDTPRSEVEAKIIEAGFNFHYLDGSRITGEEDFFRESQAALGFPAYFGKNWDAFDDCVTDLSWLPPAKANVILYDNFDTFARTNEEQFKLAYFGLEYATRRGTAPLPCYVLVRGDTSLLPEKVRTLDE